MKRRFRRARTRSYTRKAFKAIRRSHKKGMLGQMEPALYAVGYGAAREPISRRVKGFLTPYVGNFLGEYTDEGVMIAANYVVGRYFPAVRKFTNAGMIAEGVRIGQKLSGKYFGSANTITSTGSW